MNKLLQPLFEVRKGILFVWGETPIVDVTSDTLIRKNFKNDHFKMTIFDKKLLFL